jgi:hypothetical protein
LSTYGGVDIVLQLMEINHLWRVLGCWLAVAVPTAGCTASPPARADFGLGGSGRYATYAHCTPRDACPGTSCGINAAGAPDRAVVVFGRGDCATLDLAFAGGVVQPCLQDACDGGARVNPDLRLHLGPVQGVVVVQASRDGRAFSEVAWLVPDGTSPPLEPNADCVIEVPRNAATVDFALLDRCNSIDNVSALQLTCDVNAALQCSAVIDAVEALTFNPNTQ